MLFLGLALGFDRQIDATPELVEVYAVPLAGVATRYAILKMLNPDYSLLSEQEIEAGIKGLLERKPKLLHPKTWWMSDDQYDLREQLVALVRNNGGVGQIQALLAPARYQEAYFRIKSCEPLFKYLIAYAINKGHVEMTELLCFYAHSSNSDCEYYMQRAGAKKQYYQLVREWQEFKDNAWSDAKKMHNQAREDWQELKAKAVDVADDVQRQVIAEWQELKKQANAAVEEVQDAWKKMRDGSIKPEVDKAVDAGSEIMRQVQVALDCGRTAIEKLRLAEHKTEENAATI